MGTKYVTNLVSGYNNAPPADDASQTASNQIKWSTIKSKLPDPLNTAIVAINSALVTAFDYSARTVTTTDSSVAGDHMRTIEIPSSVTATFTFSLADAAAMTNGYILRVRNSSAVAVTIGRVTGGDTIDGTAGNVSLPALSTSIFAVNAAANGYHRLSGAAAGANADITSLAGLTTPLSVAQGGQGVATLASKGILFGNGTSEVGVTAVGTATHVLTSNGAGVDPTFQAPGPQIHTIQKFTASGTYTKPAGLRAALIYVKACGGSGGGSSVLAKGGGGGEGQEGWLLVAAASISASETVTIAAAAAAINANTNANGNTGGTCSFGTLLTAAGGVGGTAGNNGGAPGLGGTGGSGADWYMAGAAGQPGGDSDGITIALNSAGGGKGGSTGTPVANSGGGGGPGGIAGASGTGATGICTVIECY